MAIWCFQASPGALHIVDYYELSGYGFDHYCAWLDDRGYHGVDYVPHDARMRELGSPGGRTRIETLIKLGRKPKVVPNHKIPDRINAGRKTIPLAKFDATRCAKGLEALREYKAEWDEEARTFKRTPNHDWASHAADAWGYLSVDGTTRPSRRRKRTTTRASMNVANGCLRLRNCSTSTVAKKSASGCEGCAEFPDGSKRPGACCLESKPRETTPDSAQP